MVPRRAWVLNFDADEELAAPVGYTPSRAVLARFEELTERARGLLGPGDVVIAPGDARRLGAEILGRAWCPTSRARRALEKAGVTPAPAPPLEILRAVNHRRFSASLGQTLPGARYADTLDEIEEALAGPSPSGLWLVKRPFGFAGRGRRRIRVAGLKEPGQRRASLAQDDAARVWIEASLRAGEGVQVEPWVERLGDFGLHGHVSRAGEVWLGEPARQECDATGAWQASSRVAPDDLAESERGSLFEEARLSGEALYRAGYFGPFGIDAFRWKDEAGRPRWNPRCEINARYSMGWAIGMGSLRPDLEAESDRGEPLRPAVG